jgi:hypothetical protein
VLGHSLCLFLFEVILSALVFRWVSLARSMAFGWNTGWG